MKHPYLEKEIYFVEPSYDDQHKKQIHIDGYFRQTDNGYSHCQYSFCIIPLEEAANRSFIDDMLCSCKMYEWDYTEEEMVRSYGSYYNLCKPTYLPMSEVTEDTPCGCYVNMKDPVKEAIAASLPELRYLREFYLGKAGGTFTIAEEQTWNVALNRLEELI